MRRSLTGVIAFLVFSAAFLVPPVHAAPQPRPAEASTESIPIGSVAAPASGVLVRAGTGEQAVAIPDASPTLSVTRTDTKEFSLVGVTWTYDPAVTDPVVRVRIQSVAGTWGEWTQVEVQDPGQDAAIPEATTRGGTEPLWTGPSTGVEAEVVTRSGADPVDVRVDLVDPGTNAADAAFTAPAAALAAPVAALGAAVQNDAEAAVAVPPIQSRADWGADESIRTLRPQYASALKAATLHHTVSRNDYAASEVPAMIRAIYRYHAVSRGWGDIGYHLLVDRFGRLWEGRYGGLDKAVIGAHAGGFNTGTVGVSLLGEFDTAEVSQPMVDAAVAFIAWKFSLAGADPSATTTLVSAGGGTSQYPAGTRVKMSTIFAHRDVGRTVCPGQYAYARLPEIRTAVAQQLSDRRA